MKPSLKSPQRLAVVALALIITGLIAFGVYRLLATKAATTTNTIGFIGCSNSQRTVSGYFRAGGNRFWSGVGSYGGGTIVDWQQNIGQSTGYWASFKQYQAASPAKIIWVSVCLHPSQNDQAIYNASLAVIAEVKKIIPDATIYFSAINGFVAPHACGLTGLDGPARANALSDRLASEGRALRGPNVGDLMSIYQTPSNGATASNNATESDGCHPNDKNGDGQLQTGRNLMNFPAFSNAGTPPPKTQCSDGIDNDRDGKTDLSDPGCSSSADNNEADDPVVDKTPPNPPGGVAATALSAGQVKVSWNAATDNTGGTGIDTYEIFRDGTSVGIVSAPTTTLTDANVKANTTYKYTVAARDKAGNAGAQSTAAIVTTPAKTDTTPPSTPTGLKATATTTTSVTLGWNASTDNKAVAGYKVNRGPVYLGSTASTSYTNTGLTAGTTYVFSVSAFDTDGNTSAASSNLEVTTQSNPTEPPPPPPPPPTTGNGNGGVTITPPGSEAAIDHIDYLVNGKVVASSDGSPVTIDPSLLANGSNQIETKIYGKDGSVESSQTTLNYVRTWLDRFVPKRYQPTLVLGVATGVPILLIITLVALYFTGRLPWLASLLARRQQSFATTVSPVLPAPAETPVTPVATPKAPGEVVYPDQSSQSNQEQPK